MSKFQLDKTVTEIRDFLHLHKYGRTIATAKHLAVCIRCNRTSTTNSQALCPECAESDKLQFPLFAVEVIHEKKNKKEKKA